FECYKLAQNAKKLVVQNFKKCLCFSTVDGMLVSSPHSDPAEDQKTVSPLEFYYEEVSSKVKTSTVPLQNNETFDDIIKKELNTF
ncbi:MAG: hypothetical protein EZS28_001960, partial [Streblomastix strix]